MSQITASAIVGALTAERGLQRSLAKSKMSEMTASYSSPLNLVHATVAAAQHEYAAQVLSRLLEQLGAE